MLVCVLLLRLYLRKENSYSLDFRHCVHTVTKDYLRKQKKYIWMVRNWHYCIMDFDAMRGTEKTVEVSDSFNIALGSQEEVKSQLESTFTSFQQTKFYCIICILSL